MRFGRILESGDELFGASCQPSDGAVILGRTNTDDYVRFRVPDTNCPPLPRPNSPLDSGQADVAEPNRWQIIGTPNTSNKWLIKQQTDQIQLSYACYPGDFELEFEVSDLSVLSGGSMGVIFDGIVVELRIDDNNWACVGFGFTVGSLPGFCWQRMVDGQLAQGHVGGPWEPYESVFRARVIRSGSSWSVRIWSADDPIWSNPINLGNIGSGPVWLRIRGLRVWLGSGYNWWSTRNVQGRVRYLISNSVSPSTIWVQSPVLDLGRRRRLQAEGLPEGVQLLWRGSDQLPLPDTWNNTPEGRFRYWQVRLQTSNLNTLLERLEITPYDAPGDDPGDGGGPGDGGDDPGDDPGDGGGGGGGPGGQPSLFSLLLRRFRSYWLISAVPPDRRITGPFRTVFGSGGQRRTGENEWMQTSNEERNIGDGWK